MKSAYSILLIALTLFLSAGYAASKESRTEQHKGNATKQTESIKQQQPQVPLSVWQSTEAALSEAIRTIKQEAVAAEKQAEAYEETYGSPPVVVNIILAILGAGYLVFACLQWLAIKKQATITKEAAEKGKDALVQLEAPCVSIWSVDSFIRQANGMPYPHPWFKFGFRNDGRSVAELTSVCGIVRVISDRLPIPPDYSEGIVDKSGFFVGPNSNTDMVRWTAFLILDFRSLDEFQGIMDDKAHIIFFGYVKYTDVFKSRWISGWAWRWNPRDSGIYLAGGSDYNYARKDE